jgi:GT2 family glycosyltransferase
MKIAIGIGVNENIRTKTFSTILSILKKNPKIDVLLEQSCYIHKNRERLAERAIEGGYDYLFFVDADMCFAPEVLDRLLSRNKDIIGANYYKRNPNKETITKFIENGQFVAKPIPEDLFECASLGTGCMLISVKALKNIPKPYFDFNHKGKEVGEDVYFCLKAKDAGYEIWCDGTMEIGHVGEFIY